MDIKLIGKGFNYLKDTLVLYGRAKLDGDEKLARYIEDQIALIETLVESSKFEDEES